MMPTDSLHTIPEQGQIVTVRGRPFVVTHITPSTLPPNPMTPTQPPQHLLTLTAIEDDALGQTLQLIWEIEVGTAVSEKVSLPTPTRFDTPDRLDAFLHAVRWGAIATADTRALQAPFRSGIEIEDYQLDPLVRAVQMPRVSLLIADDVGLGKTVEAGLVMQELLVRGRARTFLIVCPAGLQIHWRDQMRDKFGLDFRIVDSQLMKTLRRSRGIHVNPWSHFPRLITSIDFLKRDRPMRLLRQLLPEGNTYPRKFDLLLIDEAHNVAPAGNGQYAVDSLRTQAIRTLAPHFEHKLFLTATPHNGYQESFSALLELLDNQRFARGVFPNRRQLDAIMVRRLKSDFIGWDGTARFPKRRLEAIEVAYPDEERQVHAWLKEYAQLRHQHATEAGEHVATEFVMKLLKKRLFSSPAAFATTLAKHQQTMMGGKEERVKKRPSVGILRRQIAQIEEEYADDYEYEEATGGATATASQLFRQLTVREQWLLQQMQAWAEQGQAQRDAKTKALIAWLRQVVKPDEVWNHERVIIFTEYRATQNWLHEILVAERLAGNGRLLTLYGGMDSDEREAVKAAFQAHPTQSDVRILLATDAASEGIDLQNHCHRLVHFEIPWNPNRLEQRNGRIDRHGQQHDPLVFHFAPQGYATHLAESHTPRDLDNDLEFLMQAAHKVEQIREDLGKVGPVIAAQVEEAMLGKRTRLDTSLAEADAGAVKQLLKFERDLKKRVEALMAQLQESRRVLEISPENIHHVVTVALELANQPPLQPVAVEGIPDGKAFRLPALEGSWESCADGLAHPHTGEMRPIVFENSYAKRRDDVVLAHLNHRLVQMSLRLLRAEVWSAKRQQNLSRVTARTVPNTVLTTPAVVAYARVVVIGGNRDRLHEEVITAGGIIREGRFRRFETVSEMERVIASIGDSPTLSVPTRLQDQLASLWPSIQSQVARSLEVRQQNLVNGMKRQLQQRADREQRDIETVLTELAQAIETELDAPSYKQLELFNDTERTQLVRNTEALQARLAQIPAEIEAEQAVIRERYADPQPRLFPVAVMFLVPEKLVH